MIQAVRTSVRDMLPPMQHVANPANLSLLFNRLCRGIDEPGAGEPINKQNTIDALRNGYKPDCHALYKHAFKRWRHKQEQDLMTICFEMKVTSPMVVGKGDQNVHEFGITLQLPWGMPVIPGSAIKGVLSTFAHEQGDDNWQKNALSSFAGQYALIMFGGTDEQGQAHAGCLDFMDAWWIPRNRTPFIKDIITVHNRSYYQGEVSFPAGTDDPVPNSFIVIKPGERFFFSIRGTEAWCELAKDMLKDTAREYGFGAKTRVGYGRLEYQRSIQEIEAGLPKMDNEELIDVFQVYGNDPSLADAFRHEAKNRPYDDSLNQFFRRFRPAFAMLRSLQNTTPEEWGQVRNIYNQFRNDLPAATVDPTDPDIQEIFRICQPLAPADLPPEAWLWRFAPAAEDLITGRDVEQIDKLITGYDQPYPPLTDFRDAISAAGHFDETDKELLLDTLETQLAKE